MRRNYFRNGVSRLISNVNNTRIAVSGYLKTFKETLGFITDCSHDRSKVDLQCFPVGCCRSFNDYVYEKLPSEEEKQRIFNIKHKNQISISELSIKEIAAQEKAIKKIDSFPLIKVSYLLLNNTAKHN